MWESEATEMGKTRDWRRSTSSRVSPETVPTSGGFPGARMQGKPQRWAGADGSGAGVG